MQNPTPSEQANTEASADPYAELARILSEMPTDKAMKELAKTTAPLPAVRATVESMALQKDFIMKLMRAIKTTERIAVRQRDTLMLMMKLDEGTKAVADHLEKIGFTWDMPITIGHAD